MRRLPGPALLILGLLLSARAAPAQPALVMSKNLSGHVTTTSLGVTLGTVGSCDETAALVPDGSRLVSDWFSLTLDAKGRGTFRGGASLLDPAGIPIAHVILHGMIGVPGGAAADCSVPGRIDGVLEPAPTLDARGAGFRQATSVSDARFTLDAVPAAAGPTALYTGRLDGLLTPVADVPPPASGLTITTGRDGYRPGEPITAFLENATELKFTLTDHHSYCSVVSLERQRADGSWEEVWPCLLATPTRQVDLPPHARLVIPLPPGPDVARHEPGVYRVTTNAAGAGGASLHVESNRFLVFAVRSDVPDRR